MPTGTGLLRAHLGNDQGGFVPQVAFLGVVSGLLSWIATLVILTHGHQTQYPASDPHLGWTDGPDSRGSLNIISACASTIFTCVYVSVHLDVPDRMRAAQVSAGWAQQRNIRVPAPVLRFFAFVWTHGSQIAFLRPMLWVAFNVVAPELIVVVAVLEMLSARDGVKAMRARGQEGWTMAAAFFADMGGYQLEDGPHLRNGRAFIEWYDSLQRDGAVVRLDVERITRDIEDRANADPVLKLFTVLQAAWFFIATFARLAEKKAISPLEAATCSYIVCTVTTYVCWLHKPYGVNGRIVLRRELLIVQEAQSAAASPELPHQLPSPINSGDGATEPLLPVHYLVAQEKNINPDTSTNASPTAPAHVEVHTHDSVEPVAPVIKDKKVVQVEVKTAVDTTDVPALPLLPQAEVSGDTDILPTMLYENARYTPFNRSWLNPDKAWPLAYDIGGMTGCIIGLIHGVPLWNTLWANTTGQWLWRFACIIQIAVPVLLSIGMNLEKVYNGRMLLFAMGALTFLYVVSRAVVGILIFMAFWGLPASAYTDVDWAWSSFPHWQ